MKTIENLETSKIPKTLVKVAVENCDEIPHQYMNETYRVAISYDEIKITAATEWGILRGLETLGLAHFRFIFSPSGHLFIYFR